MKHRLISVFYFTTKYRNLQKKKLKNVHGINIGLNIQHHIAELIMIIGNDNRTVFTEVEKASILLSAIKSSIRMNESGMEFIVGDNCKISMTEGKIELTCGSSTIILNSSGEITGKGK